MDYAIQINNIKKSYDNIAAVDGVTFEVAHDTVFGLVGPDGAGKTTLIRILCGLIDSDSGTGTILGKNILKDRDKIKNDIGYLSQKFSLYVDLSVDENIEFFAEIHGVKDYKKRREELLEFTRLTKFRKFLAGKLSGGMKQKLALACTLIHRPKIIFLDEPTTGVDPVSRRDFWKILSELHHEGVTILISTPYMDEAERFDRLAMMNHGKILSFDTPANIKKSMNKVIMEIHSPELRNAYKILSKASGYEIQLFGDRIDIAADDYAQDSKKVKDMLAEEKIEITDIRTKPVSLENVFIHLLKSA